MPKETEPNEIPEIDSKYRLIILSAQRTKQLRRGAKPRIDIDANKHKPTRIAMEELMRGTVNFGAKDREEPQQQRLFPNEEYLALALVGDRIKLVSLSPDGHYKFLDERQALHDFVFVTPFSVSHLQEAIAELEWLVNNPKAKEKDFQAFFRRNKDFILNDEYKDAHSHIVLAAERGELVPDFVLEPVDQGALCDLLELKLPSARLFTLKKNRTRYSAAVAEACAQLREYGRFFEDERNRKAVFDKYGLKAYKPKMFVIIGRRSIIDPLDQRHIESGEPDLHLRTYDDILTRMKWRAEKLEPLSP